MLQYITVTFLHFCFVLHKQSIIIYVGELTFMFDWSVSSSKLRERKKSKHPLLSQSFGIIRPTFLEIYSTCREKCLCAIKNPAKIITKTELIQNGHYVLIIFAVFCKFLLQFFKDSPFGCTNYFVELHNISRFYWHFIRTFTQNSKPMVIIEMTKTMSSVILILSTRTFTLIKFIQEKNHINLEKKTVGHLL